MSSAQLLMKALNSETLSQKGLRMRFSGKVPWVQSLVQEKVDSETGGVVQYYSTCSMCKTGFNPQCMHIHKNRLGYPSYSKHICKSFWIAESFSSFYSGFN